MQTSFSPVQLADPDIAEADKILRTCVHCGFCLATCPTYVLLGDELDSPRGRIYLIKDMLENDRAASDKVTLHIDRCLSCLSCMTTCPSGVQYMHLVDQARVHIEETGRRPLGERLLRWMLATVIPRPALFRLALAGARLVRPFKSLMPGRLKGMIAMAPPRLPSPSPVDLPQVFAAEGSRRKRVALLAGCAQQVLGPQINEATIRLLTRHGVEVVVAKGAGCCGSLTHHMGRETPAHAAAKANLDAWMREVDGAGLDAVVINASGCGTTIKDYGYMFRAASDWAGKAARVSALARDVAEFMSEIGLGVPVEKPGEKPGEKPVLAVAYHAACSLQHGQRIRAEPKLLLAAAGFQVIDVPEGHLCCGSAGTYNMLQPELASSLRDRKVAKIERTRADVIATGNIGCMVQIAGGTGIPVVHTVELLDWATGGPKPAALHRLQ